MSQGAATTIYGARELICQCSLAPDEASAVANARLIAAAPDLLALLKVIRTALLRGDSISVVTVGVAIAKAEARQ